MVTSAAEAETHGIFHNAKRALPLIYALEQMGHKQLQPTPIKTDNSTTEGFVHNNIQMKRSKAWDMQLHWLRDQENKKFFNIFWDKGINNDADYHTKHHPTVYHCRIQAKKIYVRHALNHLTKTLNSIFHSKGEHSVTTLRGCVNPSH